MKINVAYSCNEAYIHHTGISILSLLEKNKLIPDISIYFISKGVRQSSIDLLVKLVEHFNRKLIVFSFYDLCYDLNINSMGRHIETIYAKLFFSRIEGIDKILYIDSDTIINESLAEFWQIDMGDNYAAGVETYTAESKKKLGLDKSDRFINDGIVMINLREVRDRNLLEEFKKCIGEYNGNPPLLSEGVLNKVCKGKIKIIHPKFNLMSGLIDYKGNQYDYVEDYYTREIIEEAVNAPVIIHYLSAFYNRPWDINCTHPLKDLYLFYKSKSFWKEIPLEDKKLSMRLRIIKNIYKILPHHIPDLIRHIKSGI
jgi:lipopolysaccharide biosynthesis glycosyltransferase